MKILYGVVGEGMGHATRSAVVGSVTQLGHHAEVIAGPDTFDRLVAGEATRDRMPGPTLLGEAHEDIVDAPIGLEPGRRERVRVVPGDTRARPGQLPGDCGQRD